MTHTFLSAARPRVERTRALTTDSTLGCRRSETDIDSSALPLGA